MSADFEKDEIKDSPFPVKFNDDSVPIDMYGVWVKSGPRDASMPETQSETVPAETNVIPVPPEEYPDLPDLPDLDAEENPVAAPESDFASIPDISGLDEALSAQEQPVVGEEFPVIEFDEVINDTFSSKSNTLADVPEPEKEIETDEFTEIPVQPTSVESTVTHSLSLDDTADIDLNDFLLPEEEKGHDMTAETAIPDNSQNTCEPVTSFEEISTGDFTNEKPEMPEMSEMPLPDVEAPVAEISAKEEETPPVFENDVSFEIDSPDAIDKGLPSDDEFSSFLDDLNTGNIPDSSARNSGPVVPAGSPSDDLDLDDFINSVNETGAPSKETAEKVFDDQEPLNIDLEFDESFIEDVEKIRATGALVSESEFENSEFGVEMIDETAVPASDDFDALLASAQDTPNPVTPKASKTAQPEDETGTLEVTNEFDDLLDSLDLAPAPAASQAQSSSFTQRAHSYDLAVTEEDGDNAIATTVSESSVDDDLDVPLFGAIPDTITQTAPEREPAEPASSGPVTEPVVAINPEPETEGKEHLPEANTNRAEEENLDIPDIRDYNETESGLNIDGPASPMEETVSPDFDDISAVEKELNDFVPEAGEEKVVTNDKSTELLMLIANELSSIKTEITTLKSEFAGYKAKPAEGASEIQEPAIPAQKENSGFFSDDDTDETIALTGDELNNILITADFTEEKNLEDEPVEPAADTVDAEIPDAELDVAAPQFNTDDSNEIPETLPDSILDTPGFEAPLPPVDVAHVTTVEDETGYLEGSDISEPDLDNVAIEEPDLETIDFEDEKLEEPELTEFNLDLSEIESSFPAEQEVAKTAEPDIPASSVEIPSSVAEPDFTAESLTEAIAEKPAVPEVSISEDIPTIEEPVTATNLSEPSSSEDLQTVETVVEPPVTGAPSAGVATMPVELKDEIKSVLSYMDQLLESLPEEKIEEFARSEHFEVYKKLFEELGIS